MRRAPARPSRREQRRRTAAAPSRRQPVGPSAARPRPGGARGSTTYPLGMTEPAGQARSRRLRRRLLAPCCASSRTRTTSSTAPPPPSPRWTAAGKTVDLLPADPRRGGHRHHGARRGRPGARGRRSATSAAMVGVDRGRLRRPPRRRRRVRPRAAPRHRPRDPAAPARPRRHRHFGDAVRRRHAQPGRPPRGRARHARRRRRRRQPVDLPRARRRGPRAVERSSGSASPASRRPRTTSTWASTSRRRCASLEAHAAYNAALPDDFPKPRRAARHGSSGWGGKAAGVDKALTLDVVDRR